MIQGKRVVFKEPNVVQLESYTFDPQPSIGEVIIETEVSIISAGTELACLSGTEDWAKLPFYPGYGAVGRAIAVGDEIRDVREGDQVFTYGQHASHAKSSIVIAKVPVGLDPSKAVFARMANVAITALRVSDAELGDRIAVIGLGLVGNLASQIFRLAGCEVMGIDVLPGRLEAALRCGVEHVVNPSAVDPLEEMRRWTNGKGAEVVVEASGNPQAALLATKLAGKKGEVILLGTPRKPFETNVTDLLRQVHLWQTGCVTLKGAHEWRFPIKGDDQGFTKHSIERNAKINLNLIAEGKIRTEPLLTHTWPPERCVDAYRGLREHPDESIGVIFAWSH